MPNAKCRMPNDFQIPVYRTAYDWPAVNAMLCIARKRIATPVCALVRNDKRFDDFYADFGAECFENIVIARSEATWQSVTPAFEECHCPKGNQFDKLEFEDRLVPCTH